VIVVDTNLLAYSVLPGESSELADRVAAIDPEWVALALWRLELSNVLATTMRVRGLTLAQASEAFAEAERLVIDADIEPSIAERLEIAARGSVSAYDAEFVFVAERLGLHLVTGDQKLAKAFPESVRRIEDFLVGGEA